MSGINMFVGSAQAQADSIRSMKTKEVQGYESVIQSLNQFLNAEDLRTDAYDNGKAFFSGVLIPTLQAAILVSEAVGKAAQKFVTDYQSTVDPGDLKSDDLEEKIERLNTQLQHLDHLTQATSGSDISEELKRTTLRHQKQQRNHLLNAKRVLQETLDDLLEFHGKSPDIFSAIAELEAAAKQGASQAKSGFNGNKFVMPSDLAWTSFVSSKWKEYQEEKSNNEFSKLKERIKKEKLPATKAEILAEYHWSTIHNMYVHTKTGIPSPEVTKLYNKLVQAEHEPQQDPQLAFYNEMLRTGKHPITGKSITEAERINAKAMVYALALQPFVGAWALAKYAQALESDDVEVPQKQTQQTKPSGAKGLVGVDFEDYLTKEVGGSGSFSVEGRDFDGGLGNKWWEAKSGRYWERNCQPGKGFEKFKSDMGSRLRIAKDNGATYELYSNTPIPNHVKEWLTKKGIPFHEILD